MWSIVTDILGGVVGITKDWYADNREIKKAKVKAKIQRIEIDQKANNSADEQAVKNMQNTFKDEFLMFVFLAPCILAFFPSMQDIVAQGFTAIEKMPAWYKVVIIGIVSGVFGMRWLFQPLMAVLFKKFGIIKERKNER